MVNLAESTEQLMGLIGNECVYKERGLVLHVEIISISVRGDMLEFKFKKLLTPGFTKRPIRTFTWRCMREYISFYQNRICSSLLGTEIFFINHDVRVLVNFLQTHPNDSEFITKLRGLRRP